MGNSHKRDKNLHIYIETQKSFYNSGSIIQGVIYVKAEKNFTFDALYIRIQGHESCEWVEGSSKNRRKYTGNQSFYTVQHIIEKYKDKHLSKGQYGYPFALQLSQNIPGSFLPNNYEAKIQYRLIVYFVNYSDQQSIQIEHIPIIIRQPFRQQIFPYEGGIQRSPKNCFCFSQGIISLNALFQRNVAYEGESVRIDITANNGMGKKDLNMFIVELVQYVFVCANNGVYRTYTKIVSIKISEKKTFSYDLKIPQIKHQTAIGTLVANYYRIEVSTKSSPIASEDPCIYAPIFLLKKDLKEYTKMSIEAQKLNQQFKKIKFNMTKPKFFSAPQYWFKKNKNLCVMNFKLQDNIGIQTQSFSNQ